MYWRAMMQIEAQETLQQLKQSDFPHLKGADRKKHWKSVHSQAFPRDSDKLEEISNEDFAKRLGKLLNG